jgi:hypothetical protein
MDGSEVFRRATMFPLETSARNIIRIRIGGKGHLIVMVWRKLLDFLAERRFADVIRFLTVLHSPTGFVETGLRVCPPEKMAVKLG